MNRPATLASSVLVAAAALAGTARADVTQPQSIIDRPRTLPAGELELDGTYVYANIGSASSVGLGAGYGLTSDLDVHVAYDVGISPDLSGKRPITIDLGYTFLRSGALSAAAHVSGGVDLADNSAMPLGLGANVFYKLAPQVALFTGALAGANQLSIALSGDTKPIDLAVPVGVGVQLSPQLYVQAQTVLASFGLHDSKTLWIGSDLKFLDATAFVSLSPALDLFGEFSTLDVTSPGDLYAIRAGVRAYF
jgi:hypothetical protein